jgi:hypothetical protein
MVTTTQKNERIQRNDVSAPLGHCCFCEFGYMSGSTVDTERVLQYRLKKKRGKKNQNSI